MSVKDSILSLLSIPASIIGLIVKPFIRFSSICGIVSSVNRAAYYRKRFKKLGKSTLLGKGVSFLNPEDISIGQNCNIQKGCVIESWHFPYLNSYGDITIGNMCDIGEYSHITSINRIIIGDNLLTGRFVLITDNTHGLSDYSDLIIPPVCRKVISKGPVIIGDNVWLGDKVSVLPGVTIGDGAIIAANAVVTHDIPPYSLAAGVPARIIKRHSEKYNQ